MICVNLNTVWFQTGMAQEQSSNTTYIVLFEAKHKRYFEAQNINAISKHKT